MPATTSLTANSLSIENNITCTQFHAVTNILQIYNYKLLAVGVSSGFLVVCIIFKDCINILFCWQVEKLKAEKKKIFANDPENTRRIIHSDNVTVLWWVNIQKGQHSTGQNTHVPYISHSTIKKKSMLPHQTHTVCNFCLRHFSQDMITYCCEIWITGVLFISLANKGLSDVMQFIEEN